MKVTVPYLYKVTHTPTGQYYYGVRYTEGCHPSESFDIYATSSWVVKQMIRAAPQDWNKEVLFEGNKETVLIEEASLIKLSTSDPLCLNGNTLVNSVRSKKENANLYLDTTKVDKLLKEIGILIRSTRKAKKLNATELALASNISRVTLHRIEKGYDSISMGSVFSVLVVLELEYLFNDIFN